MIKLTYSCLFLILAFAPTQGLAQEAYVGLLAKVHDNKVQLKVVPRTAYHWLKGIEHGYEISRREIGQSKFQPIHSEVLKPAREMRWLEAEKGKEMYTFHQEAVTKISAMITEGEGFLTSFRQLQRADENFKMYILISMREKTFGEYAGLEMIDETAQPGKLYEYKAAMKGTEFESEPVIFDSDKSLKSPAPVALSQDGGVRLTWVHDESLPILAYHIERSATGLQYDRVTQGPIWPTDSQLDDTVDIDKVYEVWHQDSLTVNYQPHYYRIVAVDAWGDEWDPSEPVKQMGVDQTGPEMGDVRIAIDSIARNFQITWEPSLDTDVHSYFITRAHETKGMDTIVVQGLPPREENRYVFEKPIEMKNYYFKVGAIDTSGNYSVSAPVGVYINDITPPTLDSIIQYVVDSTGQVSLSWPSMKDHNPKGYWVFKSFKNDDDFIKITDTVLTANYLTDNNSLSLLHHEVYYYITALDESYNESEPTKVIKVTLPDTIPPSATYISAVTRDRNVVKITWDTNQSEDVANYQLYKRLGISDWTLVGTLPNSSTDFEYEESDPAITTEYKIVALDDGGNHARLQPVFRFVPMASELQTFELDLNITDTDLSLSWKEVGKRYKLYGGKNDQYEMLEYLDTNSYSVPKDEVTSGTSFYLKAYDNKGRLVSISQTKRL